MLSKNPFENWDPNTGAPKKVDSQKFSPEELFFQDPNSEYYAIYNNLSPDAKGLVMHVLKDIIKKKMRANESFKIHISNFPNINMDEFSGLKELLNALDKKFLSSVVEVEAQRREIIERLKGL